MENLKLTFKKEERLCNFNAINELFSKGKKIHSYPFLIVFKELEFESEYPAQILFSISKKKIKRAVNRNLIKRRLKEAYRHQKNELYSLLSEKNKKIGISFIYLDTKPLSYQEMEVKMKEIFAKLMDNI